MNVPNPELEEPLVASSEFAAADHMLSREGVLSSGAGVQAADGADLSEYYPVGTDFDDGNLYLLSKAYSSLLVVDSQTVAVTAVHGLSDIGDFSDIVVNQDGVFVLSREGESDVVCELNGLQ